MNTHVKTFPPQETCPARLPAKAIASAWLGSVLAAAALLHIQAGSGMVMILGSFGASCLLVFAYPNSPFAQPRSIIGGHFTASLTGLVFLTAFGANGWSIACAVGTAVALMLLLRVPHPPAGSNPFIVMLSGAGWDFLLTPTLAGALVLVAVALVYHRLGRRRYPTFW